MACGTLLPARAEGEPYAKSNGRDGPRARDGRIHGRHRPPPDRAMAQHGLCRPAAAYDGGDEPEHGLGWPVPPRNLDTDADWHRDALEGPTGQRTDGSRLTRPDDSWVGS